MILVPDKGSNSEAEDISDLDISDLSDSNRKSHGKFGEKKRKNKKLMEKLWMSMWFMKIPLRILQRLISTASGSEIFNPFHHL